MAIAKVYFDSSAFIEIAKGKFAQIQTPERHTETDFAVRLLAASRAGDIQVWTSTITIAEACHVGNTPPPDDVKRYFDSLFMSGRDGVTLIEPYPFVMMAARDLAWDDGIGGRVADRIHVASAIRSGCTELICLDGRLIARFKGVKTNKLRIIPASQTLCLPDPFRTGDLFASLQKRRGDEP